MFESQMRALASEYWGAGQKAKSGKRDLDRVIQLDPDNPDAHFVIGTYDYFADILPGMVKVAGFLVRVPGGDLERGIESVYYAGQQHGYSRLDARAILGVIFFGFEGRFNDARRMFDSIDAEYPHNARILEPLAVMDLFQPEHAWTGRARTTAGVEISMVSPEPGVRDVAERLRLYLAIAELLTGDLEAARASLESLYVHVPPQPDWLGSATRLALADVSLLLGDAKRAALLHADVAGDERAARRLRYVLEPDAAATPDAVARMAALQPAIAALYARDLSTFNRAVPDSGDANDPYLEFYRGEFELLRGTPQRALAHFERLTRAPLAPRWRLFRFLAFVRTAEIHGRQSQNDLAARALEQALEFHSDPDLLRHTAKARKRFYENGQPQGVGAINGGLTRRSSGG
jgi:tetratricopeptide (TPR) repeat protein